MRTWIAHLGLLAGIMIISSACATSEEWAEWRKHPTHFASWHHVGFSLRNRGGAPPRVTRRDIGAAQAENWWGKVIIVSPEQIFKE